MSSCGPCGITGCYYREWNCPRNAIRNYSTEDYNDEGATDQSEFLVYLESKMQKENEDYLCFKY